MKVSEVRTNFLRPNFHKCRICVNIITKKNLNTAYEFETSPMKYLGAGGHSFMKKSLKSKISCQTPFKIPELVMYTGVPTYLFVYRGN